MSTYHMADDTIVKTENASNSWSEQRDWDGHNKIGRSSGSQWHYQTLYRSRKGRYYTETTGSHETQARAEWVSNEAAVRWLLLNEHDMPEELKSLVDGIEE